MPKWIVGLAFGALALIGANWALANYPAQVKQFTDAVDLASTAIGFLGVAVGLGGLTYTAATTANGLTGLSREEILGPGVVAIVGAIMLAVAA